MSSWLNVGMNGTSGSTPGLTKSVWSDADFDQMAWHDATIHAVAANTEGLAENFRSRLLVDLDYLVAWVPPAPPEESFSFWVSPATLAFDDVFDLEGDISSLFCELTVNCLHRLPPDDQRPHLRRWHIEGHEFDLKFCASGYHQYIRQAPTLTDQQALSLAERGGLAFTEFGCD